MNEILLANLFFIITGSAVLVVATFVCILCYHMIRFTKRARALFGRVEASTELLVRDVQALRDHIVDGTILRRMFSTVKSMLTSATRRHASSRKKKEDVLEN